jgi:uncharacterized protein (DUF58 family)
MPNLLVPAVLILLIAFLFDLALLAYAMYALLAVLLVSRYLTGAWVKGLRAERECSRLTADVGDTVAVVIEVENTSKLPILWCLLEDLLPRQALAARPPSLLVEGKRVRLLRVPGGGRRQLLYQLKCQRRGYFQLGPLVMETGDLFGLHRRYRIATKPHFLLVYPRVLALDGYDVSSRRPLGEITMTHRLYEDPTRIAGVRRYEAGDPLNRVHWRATARTGLLHSKVYEPSTVAGATLLLNFHQSAYPRGESLYRSELAVTAAASIAHTIYEMDQQVGLVTNGRDAADRIRQEGWDRDLRTRQAAQQAAAVSEKNDRLRPIVVPTRQGVDQLRQILQTLARVELTTGLQLEQLVLETESQLPRDATVIVLLPRVTDREAIVLANLRRSGYAVLALLILTDELEYAHAAGPLVAAGIETDRLHDESAIAQVCRRLSIGR